MRKKTFLFVFLFIYFSQSIKAIQYSFGRFIQINKLENKERELVKGLIVGARKEWDSKWFSEFDCSYLAHKEDESHYIRVKKNSLTINVLVGKRFFEKVKLRLASGLGLSYQSFNLGFLKKSQNISHFNLKLPLQIALDYSFAPRLELSVVCEVYALASEIFFRSGSLADKAHYSLAFTIGTNI